MASVIAPSYIQFDRKEKEEYLSQHGINTSTQREIFHALCEHWEPLISKQNFLIQNQDKISHLNSELDNLLIRLKGAKIGLLVPQKALNEDDYILLCEEGDKRFWSYLLQEVLYQICDNPRSQYLTLSDLKNREIQLPEGMLIPLPLNQISKSNFDRLASQEALYTLELKTEKVIATGATLNLLLQFATAKLRYNLKNPELIDFLARVMAYNITELGHKINEKDAGFWFFLTQIIMDNQEDLLADRKLHLDKAFFESAEVFHIYLTNQLEENKKQKAAAKDRETDMRQMEQVLLSYKEALIDPKEIEANLAGMFQKKYGDQYPAFKEEFEKAFFFPQQKTGLPVLITLKTGIIHRNKFFKEFQNTTEVLKTEILEIFTTKAEKIVKTSNRDGDITFLNKVNLENALEDFVKSKDPFVSEVFMRPDLLSEGLFYFGKEVLGKKTVEEMDTLLSLYFKPGLLKYKSYQEIFQINPPELFDTAFHNLNPLSQLWRIITGSYKNMMKQTQALALKPLATASFKKSAEDKGNSRSNPSFKEDKSAHDTVSTSKTKPQIIKKDRHYTKREQEKAWSSFKDTIHKDPE